MDRDEFSKLARKMGYANKDTIKRYCDRLPSDYIYTDNDFIFVNRFHNERLGVPSWYKSLTDNRYDYYEGRYVDE